MKAFVVVFTFLCSFAFPFRSNIRHVYQPNALLYSQLPSEAVSSFIAEEIKHINSNSTALLLSLISYGDRWKSQKEVKFNYATMPLSWKKVSGCLADARIGVVVNGTIVQLDGTADSRVASGLLALVCNVCTYLAMPPLKYLAYLII